MPDVLHVVRQFNPAVGGMETHVQALMRELVAVGMGNAVLTLKRVGLRHAALPACDWIDGADVVRVNWYGPAIFPIPTLTQRAIRLVRDSPMVHLQ